MQCLKLSIIIIKNFCVLYKIIMRSFIICIFSKNSIFSNSYASLIRICNIKFSLIFKFIKHFIFRVSKNVIIAIVQIKTRDLRFRSFNFNIIIINIRFKLFSFLFRDDLFFLIFNVLETCRII